MSKVIFGGSFLAAFVLCAVSVNAELISDMQNASTTFQVRMIGKYDTIQNGTIYGWAGSYDAWQSSAGPTYLNGINAGSQVKFTDHQPVTVSLKYNPTDVKSEVVKMQWTDAGGYTRERHLNEIFGTVSSDKVAALLNAGGMQWMYYAFGDVTNGTTPVWYAAEITYVDANDHTKGWTADFATPFKWEIGMYVQARFGDAPLPPPGGATPEPATLALFGLGLGGLALARRRRK